jgi:hypothetical protein
MAHGAVGEQVVQTKLEKQMLLSTKRVLPTQELNFVQTITDHTDPPDFPRNRRDAQTSPRVAGGQNS